MKRETSTNHTLFPITTPETNPLLLPGVLIPFKYGKGILKRYAQVREQGRVVIGIYEQLGKFFLRRIWFTTYGEKSGKSIDIDMPELELEKYAEHYWSLPSERRYWSLPLESYEWLVNACQFKKQRRQQ
jgi:hypothetical protein